MFKVGIGYDIHRLVFKRKLYLGGVKIPSRKGLLGHSDADVLLHAICDALLGAVSESDIGHHFPNNDKKYKDISSLELLKCVGRLVEKKGFRVSHIDTVVVLETPKIASHKEKMKNAIAKVLKIEKKQVSVKATTNEGMDAIGRGEAAAAYAIALIQKRRSV